MAFLAGEMLPGGSRTTRHRRRLFFCNAPFCHPSLVVFLDVLHVPNQESYFLISFLEVRIGTTSVKLMSFACLVGAVGSRHCSHPVRIPGLSADGHGPNVGTVHLHLFLEACFLTLCVTCVPVTDAKRERQKH